MEKTLLEGCLSLKEAMINDPRFLSLEEAEKKALDNEDVRSLISKKEAIQDRYCLLLAYKDKNDGELREAEKRLHQAKLELDEHPLVKEYNRLYVETKRILMEINDIIFGPFQKKIIDVEVK